jgi:short-subunit dehydrogenase
MGGIPYNGAYTATKTAVVALSESWAAELQSKDIKVAVLCPAFVQTRIYDSDRNRPLKYQNDTATPTDEHGFLDKTKHLVENGIDVSIVGKRVVEALNDGELYIFTHPNYRAIVQRRFQAIDAAFERAAQSPLLEHIANQKLDML